MTDALQVLLVAEFDEDADWISGFLRESAVPSNVERVCDTEQCSAALARARADICVSSARAGSMPAALSLFEKPAKEERPPLLLIAEGFGDVATQAPRLGASVWVPSMGVSGLVVALRYAWREAQARKKRNHERAFELEQRELLEHIAGGAKASEVLDRIVRLVERQAQGMLCSILRVDAERGVVVHGAAPSLPLEFIRSIDGSKIGEGAGSCGTAAYRKERVVVEDIATHPYWDAYRGFALPFGLKACWSSPILSANGAVLGTFAMYYREVRAPRAEEEVWVERATHLAAIAMVREQDELEQKRLTDAVRESEHLRRMAHDSIRSQAALLDRATDAILVRSIEGVVSYWNQGAERLYGYSSAEVIGRNAADFMYREPPDMLAASAELTLRGEWKGELRQRTRDGRDIVVQARWTLLRDSDFAPGSVLVINTDITEKRSLEAQVLRAHRLESLGRLAGGIAHDFNNILTAIKGNVCLALGDLEPEHPAREALSGIELAGVRAADLVRQILTFSRHEEPKRRLVSLEPLVLEALSLVRVTLPVSIEVDVSFAPDLPRISGDPSQVHQVVVNLGTNAAQAMSARGGTLRVHGERVVLGTQLVSGATELPPGEYAKLTISDTGHGMDAATLERIFDPFFTTKEPGQGTGLGLSVAHGILKSHGGGIVVSSAPCEGASFSLYFPAAS
jgi:PAS domain S-box-containing protein